MKFQNNLAAIFLCSVTFISCDIEIEVRDIEPVRAIASPVNLTLVPLNPTEQKLRGQWFLRSMVTMDTLYNDSVENHKLNVRFTEFAWPGQSFPILEENMGLYAKATPDTLMGISINETWQAPDSSTLIIQYKGGIFIYIDSAIHLQITRLEPYNLNLKDSLTGKEWKFVR